MALTKIVDGRTTTGADTAVAVGVLKNDPRGSGASLTVIVSGITTGTVQIQVGPSSSGPWITPTDGELTADGVFTSPLSQDAYIRINTTVATSIDLDVWAG